MKSDNDIENLNLPPNSRYFSLSEQSSARNVGTFCLASINRCFRSSKTDSSLDLLMNVVANPLFPDLPVRPILWTGGGRVTNV